MSLTLHQRLENMIRLGIIKTIHPTKPFMTVTVELGEITTAKIRYLNSRAGDDQSWNPPSIGEEVIVFSPSGVLELGIAFGGLNNAQNPAISQDLNKNITLYSDGCMISYDSKNHTLEAILPESGTAVLTAKGGVIINGDTTINGNVNIVGTTHSTKTISTDADISAAKNISATGGISAKGNIQSQGAISATGDIKAGSISVQNHLHPGDSGGTTGKPK